MFNAVSCNIFRVLMIAICIRGYCRVFVFLIIFLFQIIIFLVDRTCWGRGWFSFLCFFIVFIYCFVGPSSEWFAKALISFFSFSSSIMNSGLLSASSDDNEIDQTFYIICQHEIFRYALILKVISRLNYFNKETEPFSFLNHCWILILTDA